VGLVFALALSGCGGKDKDKADKQPSPSAAPAASDAPAKKAPAAPDDAASADATGAEGRVDTKAPAEPPAAPPQPTLVFWHSLDGAEKSELEALVKVWDESKPDLVVQLEALQPQMLIDRVAVAGEGSAGPDLVLGSHTLLGYWRRFGALQPAGTELPVAMLNDILPSALEAVVFEGAIWGLPYTLDTVAVYYDPARVQERPASWEQLVAAAEGFVQADAGSYGLAYETTNLYHHAAFLHAFADSVIDPSGTPALSSPEAARALDFVKELVQKPGLMPKDTSAESVKGLFNAGKVAFVLGSTRLRGDLAADRKFAVMPLPALEPTRSFKPYVAVEALLFPAKSAKKALAMELAVSLAGLEGSKARAQTRGRIPTDRRVYLSDPRPASDENAAFAEQANMARPIPAAEVMSQVWAPYGKALSAALAGEKPSRKALEDAAAEVQAAGGR
jgi:arabinogalactan oligomer/maltooligosaccharide transport system permease protein